MEVAPLVATAAASAAANAGVVGAAGARVRRAVSGVACAHAVTTPNLRGHNTEPTRSQHRTYAVTTPNLRGRRVRELWWAEAGVLCTAQGHAGDAIARFPEPRASRRLPPLLPARCDHAGHDIEPTTRLTPPTPCGRLIQHRRRSRRCAATTTRRTAAPHAALGSECHVLARLRRRCREWHKPRSHISEPYLVRSPEIGLSGARGHHGSAAQRRVRDACVQRAVAGVGCDHAATNEKKTYAFPSRPPGAGAAVDGRDVAAEWPQRQRNIWRTLQRRPRS
jgi:hypothetical protein